MKRLKTDLLLGFLFTCSVIFVPAQPLLKAAQALNAKQQSIVAISAFTAKGDMVGLQQSLNDGLNAGLAVNEIKEILVQLYAYAGFPRSLNALNTLMAVVKERKQKGIHDEPGREPNPLPASKSNIAAGTANQTKLIGRPISGEVYQFAPAIDQFLKAHLFGDIFGRDNLDWKTRELATIAALAGLGGAEAQLRSHFGVGMYNGLTEAQLQQLIAIIQTKVGSKEGNAAGEVLQKFLNKEPGDTTTSAPTTRDTVFPTGERITNNNFIGTAYLQQLVLPDSLNPTSVGNVTFEPGARSNWHYHPGGQILLAIDGVGWYQEKGNPRKILRKGDAVKCPPNIPHWHGASNDTGFVQVAITNTVAGGTVWLQPVSEEEYKGQDSEKK